MAAFFQGNSQVGPQIGIGRRERNSLAEGGGRVAVVFCGQESHSKIRLRFEVLGPSSLLQSILKKVGLG